MDKVKIQVSTHDFDTKDIDLSLQGTVLHVDIGTDKNQVDLASMLPINTKVIGGSFNINSNELVLEQNGEEPIKINLSELINSPFLKGMKGDKGDKGDNGKSAYELAVKAGYIGSEVQWLASLKGDTGAKGEKGEKGEKGNPFTYSDFTPEQIESLKGQNGKDGKDGKNGENGSNGYEPDNVTIILKDNKLTAVNSSDKHVKNVFRTEEGKLRVVVGVDGDDSKDTNYDVDLPSISTPTESLFVDVKLGLTTNKHQLNESETADIIYTITNSGSATATSVTLDITNPSLSNKRVTYGEPVIDKTKVGNVIKTSDVKYVITNLESGGAVSITIPTTFQDYGSYTYSGLVSLSENNVDKSADDNRASVKVDVTTTRDTSYQPTQSCPALNVIDVNTGKTLLLMDYGSATYMTDSNYYVQEPIHQPATMNRLNVYSPNTTEIKLRVDNAGTAVVHGYNNATVTNNALQETLNKEADGEYYFIEFSERSTGYEFNGKRYVVKPQFNIGTKSGRKARTSGQFYLNSAIPRDRRTYFGSAPKGVTNNFENGVLTISGLTQGTWLAVSFRPSGSNCEWQTVLIAVPLDITEKVPTGRTLTRKSGTESHIQINSALKDRADVSYGYVSINGDVSPDTPIVPVDLNKTDKATISAPSGIKNEYVLSVNGGKLNLNTTSTGNIKIVPNPEGTELKITVEANATASDNFIYNNNGIVIEMKVS